ncbi:hypothetical protein AAFF_G00370820 [Aldrovandia affinis]|uniref:Uncharacterized protein n=1 Tax=Aldrovandia affinis TaxID=143900 RepID=A0AAD7SH82_9TELE|nr:hypothetical protein AAFF_G00370820 [Aldrovandia affinis]
MPFAESGLMYDLSGRGKRGSGSGALEHGLGPFHVDMAAERSLKPLNDGIHLAGGTGAERARERSGPGRACAVVSAELSRGGVSVTGAREEEEGRAHYGESVTEWRGRRNGQGPEGRRRIARDGAIGRAASSAVQARGLINHHGVRSEPGRGGAAPLFSQSLTAVAPAHSRASSGPAALTGRRAVQTAEKRLTRGTRERSSAANS